MIIVSMEFERSRIPIIQPCSERNTSHSSRIACIVRTVSFVWAVIHPFGGDWLCSFVNAYHSAMCRRYVARVLIVPNKPCIVALRDVAAPCHERRGAAGDNIKPASNSHRTTGEDKNQGENQNRSDGFFHGDLPLSSVVDW